MRPLRSLAAAGLAAAVLLACRETEGARPPGPAAAEDAAPSARPIEASSPADERHDDLHRARDLFARHCALCHGPAGRGDGEGSAWLYPPARDFGLAQFRLVGGVHEHSGGGPAVDDLVRTLQRGMPGSAMPPFAWMSVEDLQGLSHLVLELARDGLVERMHEQAVAEGAPFDRSQASAVAAARLAPGEPIATLPAADVTPGLLERGRDLYAEHCAACHGMDGKGQGGEPKRNEDGSLTWARDFTAGILKGGADRHELTKRIRAGMPGSSMPPLDLPRADLVALVAWVQRLIPPGATERHLQVRSRLTAPYREVGEPTDDDWRGVPELELHTAPLAWHDQSVLDVRVSALHDADRLWLRLRWNDATREDRPLGGGPMFDAAAVQLSEDPAPPLFGMGAAGAPVNLWHWTAARWSDVAGALDPLTHAAGGDQVVVDAGGERVDAPLWIPALGKPEDATALEAQGFAHLGQDLLPLAAHARWRDGEWEVVFSRHLRARDAREVDLVIGRIVQFGCAVWNGAAGDHRGQKSITIWHELELE